MLDARGNPGCRRESSSPGSGWGRHARLGEGHLRGQHSIENADRHLCSDACQHVHPEPCATVVPQVVGDDLLVTNPKRVKQGIDGKWCNALLLKVNQIGSLTESINAVRLLSCSVKVTGQGMSNKDDCAAADFY